VFLGSVFPAYCILFIASALLTRVILVYATRRCLIDVPNERSSHSFPTPRGGGLSIVLVFLAGLTILFSLSSFEFVYFISLVGGGLLVAGVGFWDDHCGLGAPFRVFIHFLAASWALFWIGGCPPFNFGAVPSVILGNFVWLIALVWFLNVYNFMDGIDGIAAAETLFISGAASLLLFWSGAGSLAAIAAILFTATAGFLLWNLPPARIFMGDVGSGFLGIVLGIMVVLTIKTGAMSLWVWVILFGAFVSDTTVTLVCRIFRRDAWYSAHCTHAYQHAARHLKSHGKVTLAITVINCLWLFPWAIAAWYWPVLGVVFAAVAYVPLIVMAICFKAGREKVCS